MIQNDHQNFLEKIPQKSRYLGESPVYLLKGNNPTENVILQRLNRANPVTDGNSCPISRVNLTYEFGNYF